MDSMEDRFKRYEQSFNARISPRNYVILRLDGVGFSKFTKRLNKPFDRIFSDAMDEAMLALCDRFGAKIGYQQSDEISVMITDIGNPESNLIYDGKVQKLNSIASGIVSTVFNKVRLRETLLESGDELTSDYVDKFPMGYFDCRVLAISDIVEVGNYFWWRQKDAIRNSISMVAQELYSHKQLLNTNREKQLEMIRDKGQDWDKIKIKYQRGVVALKQQFKLEIPMTANGGFIEDDKRYVYRNRWEAVDPPVFLDDKTYVINQINGEKLV